MTREKEIIEASINYTMKNRPYVLADDKFSKEMRDFNRNKSFEEDAKWADKTMINKVCEWLIKGGYFVNNNETIEDFRKAMEE